MVPDRLDKNLDLIDGYIHNRLSKGQKLEFYNMLKSDSEFKLLFKQEWELHKQMQSCKINLEADTKARVLQNIYIETTSEADILAEIKNQIVNWVLKIAVPTPVLPYINKLKRSCV